jgi:hypothetical protein
MAPPRVLVCTNCPILQRTHRIEGPLEDRLRHQADVAARREADTEAAQRDVNSLANVLTAMALTDNSSGPTSRLFRSPDDIGTAPSSFTPITLEDASASCVAILMEPPPPTTRAEVSREFDERVLKERLSEVGAAHEQLALLPAMRVHGDELESLRCALDTAAALVASSGRLLRSIRVPKSAGTPRQRANTAYGRDVQQLKDELEAQARTLDALIDAVGATLPKSTRSYEVPYSTGV